MSKSVLSVLILIVILVIGGFLIFRPPNQSSLNSGQVGNQGSSSEPKEVKKADILGQFVRGQRSPDFSFTDFDGSKRSLIEFEGKPVVVDFWAAWCPFCVEEMPELEKAQNKHGDSLVIVGMHRTSTESIEKGRDFAKDRGVTYLLGSDPDDSLYRAAGGFGMPVAIFIDKNGIVIEIKSGPKTAKEIEEKVGELLAI